MYKLNVTSHFSGAHVLKGYDGACQRLHGHNWKIRVGIACDRTDEIGLAIDFKEIKRHLNAILDELDHSMLNDHPAFKDCNPTSENIARFFYHSLKETIDREHCKIADIEVWESDNTSVVYWE